MRFVNFIACLLYLIGLIVNFSSANKPQRDYYDILGVSKTATDREIKKAFKKLAILKHPDKNKSPDANEVFTEILDAYKVLSDPESRKQYDLYGTTGEGGQHGFGPDSQHDFMSDFFDGFGHFRDFDFFRNMFDGDEDGDDGGHHGGDIFSNHFGDSFANEFHSVKMQGNCRVETIRKGNMMSQTTVCN